MMATVVKSNLGFLTDPKDHSILFAFLSSFDVFTIWTVVLLIIGFAIISRVSRAKSAAIVVAMWFVAIAIKLGFAALGTLGKKA